MIIYPNAKINIGLNVVERRKDGYHNIETIFYPIELQDVIELKTDGRKKKNTCTLRLTGELLDGSPDDNLVVKAYRLLADDFVLPHFDIHLHKHIPTGAGLGGGSADAAFVLCAINEMCTLKQTRRQLEKYALRIGADCPFFVRNKPMYAEGIGDKLKAVNVKLKGKCIVLVKPNVFVSTKDAYADIVPTPSKVSLPDLLQSPIASWRDTVINDFEKSVFRRFPEIAAIKDRLYDLGAEYASMSGSGSSVFGIFDKQVKNVDDIFNGYFVRQRVL